MRDVTIHHIEVILIVAVQVICLDPWECRFRLLHAVPLVVLLPLIVRILVRYDRRLNWLIVSILLNVDLTDDSLQWLVWVVRVVTRERILLHVVPFYLAFHLQAFFLLVSFIYDLHLTTSDGLQICVDRLHI